MSGAVATGEITVIAYITTGRGIAVIDSAHV
jgi:hypothetical protein